MPATPAIHPKDPTLSPSPPAGTRFPLLEDELALPPGSPLFLPNTPPENGPVFADHFVASPATFMAEEEEAGEEVGDLNDDDEVVEEAAAAAGGALEVGTGVDANDKAGGVVDHGEVAADIDGGAIQYPGIIDYAFANPAEDLEADFLSMYH